MLENILYIILAILGLSFLVFIHELGHYFMAKRAKMRIEIFSIGFGKPIYSWYRNKIKWQIAILPFGGFVKIAGMQEEKGKDPHEIKDGFFGKKPFARIKVSLMGPLVNLVFAFFIFSVIWVFGGRDKPFSNFTKKIGYVDSKSQLYDYKVRPGDEIFEYNKKKYTGFNDVLYSSITSGKEIEIKGYKINYLQNQRVPFEYTLKTYPDSEKGKDFSTIGVDLPASYLILENNSLNSVMKDTQIQPKDRILWANGEIIFSVRQLSDILNTNRAFLTVLRNDQIIHTNINLVKTATLKTSSYFKDDLDDWRYLKKIKTSLNDLYIIPYSFNENARVEKPLNFIDESAALNFLNSRNAYSMPLQKGDRILAVGGDKIKNGSELFFHLQNPKILLITQRDPKIFTKISYKNIDKDFENNLDINSLNQIVKYLSTSNEIKSLNNLHLLDPILPITYKQMLKSDQTLKKEFLEIEKKASEIKNIQKKQEVLKALDDYSNKKILGVTLSDKIIKYNPNPIKMFSDCFKEISKTLQSLITGLLSPKYLSGPIGIIQVVKTSWSHGPLEAFYWLGFISLNLGFINLLPIPVLDGGHIVFSIVEMITKKPIKAKTMERLIIPFVVLLIGGIIFITFQDVLRIVKNFF